MKIIDIDAALSLKPTVMMRLVRCGEIRVWSSGTSMEKACLLNLLRAAENSD